MGEIITLDNVVFSTFAFYSAVSILKMMFMSVLTSLTRMKHGAYISQEDVQAFYVGKDKKDRKAIRNNEEVERVRSNHLNDMESIPAFVLLGGIYVLCNPTPAIAIWHFRIFAGSRILHTLSYQMAVQPWRALFFFAAFAVIISMGVQILMSATY